ncbi:TRAP transporter large permease [Azospirillum sp. RWY-5-1]|uniref:TRAP transporter large permease protein n=1 Tax=Azospirillum oleiclasticum TaxID=2735135 RepID=A0ABX2T7S0_9PROT|nr:TRAP transporter large permease [Azospirillum oleiclasticum]NYZ11564.1 TRAP transporter large permease [Azospirillum oleiclasticum]NYZ18725.1 TRAP transporter large permease [Azospirillum oleiclasticum]
MTESLIGVGALFTLILMRMPIGVAMGLVGVVGFALLVDWGPALAMLGQNTFDAGFSYTLSVLPLFIVMGNLVTRAGISGELFQAAHAFLGHRRGGLAMASVAACGGFSAVCGSSLATAATMSKVAMPPMRRYGYADSLAAGSIAAGGTLGILIPPSVIMVIYGLLTQADIGKLFIAGILPGVLGIALYIAAVAVATWLKPELGPPAEPMPWGERLRALKGVSGMLVLFAVIMGGIYGGIFTPTEAAGIGAFVAFLMAWLRGRLTGPVLLELLVDSARTTAMLFLVIIGALLFANFVTFAGFADALKDWVQGLALPPMAVLLAIIAIYILLGCVLESLSMILLTVPIFYPIVTDLDFGMDPEMVLIWFAVIVVVVTEISLITPPVGMNVFVLRGVLRDVPLSTIFRGVTPFLISDVIRLALLILFPSVSLLLPSLM